MLASKNTYIDSAYERLQVIVISQDKQKQLEYEARQKAILDYNQMVLEATEKGFEQGIESVAKKLIIANYPTSTIVELTDIPANIIEEMKKNLQ